MESKSEPAPPKQIMLSDLTNGKRFRTESLDRCTKTYRRVKCQGEFRMLDSLIVALVEGENNIEFFSPNEMIIPID